MNFGTETTEQVGSDRVPQTPFRIKAKWSASDIPKLDGKIAIVTGSNSGIGYEIALQLASHGAHVVLAARDRGRIEQAAEDIRRRVPDAKIETQLLDLADLKSVRDFARDVLGRHHGLDILVNNAGVFGGPLRKTKDGFEAHLGINHLGHFALTGLLLPALSVRKNARVVTMASVAVAWGRINFDDLQSERHYTLRAAYGQSKLANLLFAFELERRCKSVGLSVTSLGADPGAAKTNLFLNKGQDWGRRPNAMERLLQLVLTVFSLPVSQAALPALYQATDPSARSDRYIVGNMWPKSGFPRVGKIPDVALDRAAAQRLWEESVKLTGVNYELLLGGSAVR